MIPRRNTSNYTEHIHISCTSICKRPKTQFRRQLSTVTRAARYIVISRVGDPNAWFLVSVSTGRPTCDRSGRCDRSAFAFWPIPPSLPALTRPLKSLCLSVPNLPGGLAAKPIPSEPPKATATAVVAPPSANAAAAPAPANCSEATTTTAYRTPIKLDVHVTIVPKPKTKKKSTLTTDE